MADNPIMVLITIFIGISIVLSIGVAILSGTSGAFKCENLSGYQPNATKAADKFPAGTWSGTCNQIQQQTQQSMTLLVVILVIVAAVAILVVIKML